jgi:isopropylmalate/homocitrate/citramalate synthase
MIDRDKLWTGELNARALDEAPAAPARVGLYDTTLRDGEQTVGVVLDPDAKLEIARALDALGIDRIEAGFPRVSADDAAAVGAIAGAGLHAEVWGFSRAVPADVEALSARGWLGPGVPIHWHGHNDFGLATAAAIAAVRAGATWVQGTINGMGERAGNASLGEVALALDALYGIETGLRLERLRSTSELVRARSGYALDPWKPVTGETLFTRESGAVASQFHDPPAIEPYSAELVRAERGIVLGKKSGLDSIRIKLAELGLERPEDDWPALLAAVKERGTAKKGLVTDDEFRELVARAR